MDNSLVERVSKVICCPGGECMADEKSDAYQCVIECSAHFHRAKARDVTRLVVEECAKTAMTCPVERFATDSHNRQAQKQREDTATAIRSLAKESENE